MSLKAYSYSLNSPSPNLLYARPLLVNLLKPWIKMLSMVLCFLSSNLFVNLTKIKGFCQNVKRSKVVFVFHFSYCIVTLVFQVLQLKYFSYRRPCINVKVWQLNYTDSRKYLTLLHAFKAISKLDHLISYLTPCIKNL